MKTLRNLITEYCKSKTIQHNGDQELFNALLTAPKFDDIKEADGKKAFMVVLEKRFFDCVAINDGECWNVEIEDIREAYKIPVKTEQFVYEKPAERVQPMYRLDSHECTISDAVATNVGGNIVFDVTVVYCSVVPHLNLIDMRMVGDLFTESKDNDYDVNDIDLVTESEDCIFWPKYEHLRKPVKFGDKCGGYSMIIERGGIGTHITLAGCILQPIRVKADKGVVEITVTSRCNASTKQRGAIEGWLGQSLPVSIIPPASSASKDQEELDFDGVDSRVKDAEEAWTQALDYAELVSGLTSIEVALVDAYLEDEARESDEEGEEVEPETETYSGVTLCAILDCGNTGAIQDAAGTWLCEPHHTSMQGCCADDCESKASEVDGMGSYYCTPCADKSKINSPEIWEEEGEVLESFASDGDFS